MLDATLQEADERDEVDTTLIINVTPLLVENNQGLKKPIGRAVRIIEQPLQENKYRKTVQEKPMSATEVIELRRELKRLADEYKV